MSAKAHADDDSIEPEFTDDEIRAVVDQMYDLFEDRYSLDYKVSSVMADQLDRLAPDDSPYITVFLETEGGHGKAEIIQAVADSDIPVAIENVAPDHAQLSFRVRSDD